MGIIKKVVSSAGRVIDNATFQERVAFKFEKILKGEKIPAPKYETEKSAYKEIMNDPNIRKDLETKHEKLIENMNKINIHSSEVVENSKEKRQLPTRETEAEHKNDPNWEFFFYEPSKDKMLPNRLTLREALEILRSKYELIQTKPDKIERIKEIQNSINQHEAVKRIDEKKLEDMWKYFRPFARSDKQKVVQKADLAYLQDVLTGKEQEGGFFDIGKRDPRSLSTPEGRERLKVLDAERVKKIKLSIESEKKKDN
uniref:39S ribosomal protein L59, mitochondrial n=1 Tax=Parastrongyloides trichosuri TaxID=131310 RepID=A0A0N4ZSV3_PARTI